LRQKPPRAQHREAFLSAPSGRSRDSWGQAARRMSSTTRAAPSRRVEGGTATDPGRGARAARSARAAMAHSDHPHIANTSHTAINAMTQSHMAVRIGRRPPPLYPRGLNHDTPPKHRVERGPRRAGDLRRGVARVSQRRAGSPCRRRPGALAALPCEAEAQPLGEQLRARTDPPP
jgi:hypothetical protein